MQCKFVTQKIFRVNIVYILTLIWIYFIPYNVHAQNSCPEPRMMSVAGVAPVTLRFVGDIVLGNNHIVENIPVEWESLYFSNIEKYLKSPDASIGNLEGALTRYSKTLKVTESGRAYAFRFPPQYAMLLHDAGFKAMNVANNHSNDFGEIGFSDTLKNLNDAGLAIAGIKGKFATFTAKNLKIAIVGFGFYPRQNMIQDLAAVTELITRAKADSQYVIATFHAGAEGDNAVWHGNSKEFYLGEDRGNSVEFARAAIDAGANVVVGHGPHVLRSIECYKGKPIFYSLGNFVGVGGLSIRGLSSISAIAGVQLGKNGELLGIEFLPIVFTERKIPKVDERNFSSHLVNLLGQESHYPGKFLTVPTDASKNKAFEAWIASTILRESSP